MIGTKRRAVGGASLLLFGVVGVGARALAGGAECAQAEALVVHEWGTFTSYAGPDGVSLEGLHHEEERLPGFVHDRTLFPEVPAEKGLRIAVRGVTQKMETPVLYFHSKRERRVNVHVDFRRGLLTQWYPAATPEPRDLRLAGLDMGKVERSSLEWDVDLVPGERETRAFPPVPDEDPWAFARAVDATPVRTVTAKGQTSESERYLFYRGLGTFELPVHVAAERGGRVAFANGGSDAMPAAWALRMTPTGGAFVALGGVAAQGSAVAALPLSPEGRKSDACAALAVDVEKALVAEGLHADEARAMVRTWSRQWFASEGTRIIYLVPRSVTDAIIPLRITPKPESVVRVLVGRLEVLTPEAADELEAALLDRRDPRKDAARAEAAEKRIARFGRFLEPAVRHVVARTGDARVAAAGRSLVPGASAPTSH